MNRVSHPCCGDCAQCSLLANGEVDMMPCILDQLFRRVQNIERELSRANVTVAGVTDVANNKKKKDVQEND